MSYTWFKLHHELPDDIKIRRFTPQEKWAWVVLLCLASKSTERGVITADDEDIAEYCEFNTTQDWLYFRDKLISKGMLEHDASGNLHVLHWDDRQYEKPSDRPEATRERKRRQREKEKALKNASTEGMSHDVTRDSRPCHDTDKIRSDQTRQEEIRKEEIKENSLSADVVVSPPPKKSSRQKKSFDSDAWLSTYNTYKPSRWPECKTLSSKARTQGIQAAIAACVDEPHALHMFKNALSWIRVGGAETRFWREQCNNPCFETLLRPTKLHFLGLAEKGMARQVNPDAVSGCGLSDEQIKMARRKQLLEEEMQRWA